MSDPSKAVFLSYASQDAEAARRICEALRAAGVEVWLDQSELVGGDAWDAKIRKQIKECALFVPIISANTQARREGYFRIEWKLAAQRTHAIADGTPFLLPVLLGDVAEPAALVPAEFRDVQWTRLRAEESPAALATRVSSVLACEAPAASEVGRSPAVKHPPRASGRPRRWVRWVALSCLGVALWFALRPLWQQASANEAAFETRLRGLLRTSNREEVTILEEMTRRGTDREPQSARAWSARAFVESIHLIRGWDTGEKRRQDAQTYAQRALAIDRNDARAISVLANVFIAQGAYAEAEATARRALQVRPDDPGTSRVLAVAMAAQGRVDESVALMEELTRQFPNQSAPYYSLALLYENKTVPDFEAALRTFDAAAKASEYPEPSANILLHKAALLVGARGDFAGARALLQQLSPVDRMEDRAVGTTVMLALLERQPARARAAAGQTARTYFEDQYVPGPKAWRIAHAYRMEGKESLAHQEWRTAERVLRQRLHGPAAAPAETAALAVTLAWLGQREEAAKLMAPIEAQVKESPPRIVGLAPDHLRLLYLSYYYAGLGEAGPAVSYIQKLLNRRELLTDKTLPLDPWWDRIRGQPEFEALLRAAADRAGGDGSSGSMGPGRAPEKSVAVLAFRQLSADPENEYLCEAISDELCSVLGRVPGLKVAASASAFTFKGKRVRPSEMAAQLGVAYLVDGTVQKIGNRVRVRAQLIKAADEAPVWSSTNLDHEMKDLFAVQDEVVGAIAKNLQLRLGAETVRPAVAVHAEAFRLYYEGRRAWNLRSPEGLARAEALFHRAIEADPNFAHAYVGLADVWEASSGPKDHAKAMSHVQRALAIDPGLAEAHAALGNLQKAEFAGFRDAETSFRTAIKLNPNYASAFQWLGRFLETDGRLEEALAMERKAMELDPLSSRIADNYGRALLMAGRAREASVVLERAVMLVAENEQARCWRAWVWLILGRKVEAVEEARRLAASPEMSLGQLFASRIFYAAELRREGDAIFAKIDPTNHDPHYLLTAAVRGDDVGALFSAKHLGSGSSAMYYFLPEFEGLRRDPRFLREIDAAGLRPAFERAVTERSKLAAAAKR